MEVERGLCGRCVHARELQSARGSTFLLCRAAETDPRLRKYPALPVRSCVGFEDVDAARGSRDMLRNVPADGIAENGLRLVRECVERHVSAEDAPMVLFEALHSLPDSEDLPRTVEGLAAFARGPLREALATRIGEKAADSAAKDVAESIERAIRKGAGSIEIDVGDFMGGGPSSSEWPDVIIEEGAIEALDFHERPTLVVGDERDDEAAAPLRVLVIARSTRLAQRIRAAFGGHRVTVAWSGDADDATRKMKAFRPAVAIIDGEDPARLDPIDLSKGFASGVDARRLVVVWASDQPWGRTAAASLERRVSVTSVPRKAGVEPLLDYVRARLG